MMSTDDATDELLQELSDAKTWAERFKSELESGSDVDDEIKEADKKIEELENRAREAMKKFGCDCPETRTISRGMTDMLIEWHIFKDSLG